jgi:type III secretion protein U
VSEKTQKPTPRRLHEARKRGEVVRSAELSSLAAFAVLWICLWLGAGYWWRHLAHITEYAVLAADPVAVAGVQRWLPQLRSLVVDMLCIVGPLLAAGIAGSVLVGGLQTRGMVSMGPITPKFERINPAQGLRSLFSTRHLFDLGKMLIKTALLLAMLFHCITASLDPLMKAVYSPADDLLRIGATLAWRIMGWAAAIYVVGAVLDYAHQFYEFMKRQKMSIEELRRDYRETEGDPRIKRRRRAVAREMIFDQAMSRLPSASVVVVNPTHVSVALYYAPGETPLPRVVAKGVDALALRIRTEAKRYGVPVLEDPPLARKLFREVALDHYINEGLIDAAAAVFRWVRLMDERRHDSVRLALPETESNATDRVNQLGEVWPVDLAAQSRNVHVDEVVQRGGAPDVFPDLMR